MKNTDAAEYFDTLDEEFGTEEVIDPRIDGEWITEELLNPDAWTADFDEYCEQFNIPEDERPELVGKEVRLLSELGWFKNKGKANGEDKTDRKKLRNSYVNKGLNTELPPICTDEDDDTLNGFTREHVLPEIGFKSYCTWKLRFRKESHKVLFRSRVNDPDFGYYERSNTEDDVVINTIEYAKTVRIENNGTKLTEEELMVAIEKQSKNSLDDKQRNSVLQRVLQDSEDVEPSRYTLWTVTKFLKWMESSEFIDPLKKRIKGVAKIINALGKEEDDPDADLNVYIHNSRYMGFPNPRWANYLWESVRSAKKDKPLHRIVLTAPPQLAEGNYVDGEEDKLRTAFVEEEKKVESYLDKLYEFKFKNGCYPASHKDAILRFAPSTIVEQEDGYLFTLGDVMENIAKDEIKENQSEG